jgi:hypothetical protein
MDISNSVLMSSANLGDHCLRRDTKNGIIHVNLNTKLSLNYYPRSNPTWHHLSPPLCCHFRRIFVWGASQEHVGEEHVVLFGGSSMHL